FQKEPSPDTGVPRERLEEVGKALPTGPPDFTPHQRLKPILATRAAMSEGREPIDWAFAELLAFGTVMIDGFRVRLSGQDSGRATFAQRRALLFDYVSGAGYTPLNALARDPSENAQEVSFAVY